MRRILVSIGALALSLLLAELVVRALDPPPRPLESLAGSMYRLSEDRVLRYEYVAGFTAAQDAGGAAAGFSINGDGFRDVEHARAKPEGVVRTLVLGDSVTAGNGVPRREELFVTRLERLLNAVGGDARHELFNMGVGGYQTLQEVEALRVRGLAYGPDRVLVAFCINDFDPTSDGGVYRGLHARNADLDVGRWRRGMRSGLAPLLRSSRLAFLAYQRIAATAPPADEDRVYVEEVLARRTPVEAGLDLLARLQAEHGFEATLVLIPAFDRPFDAYRYQDLHRYAAELAARHPAIGVIDLLDDFRAAGLDPAPLSFDGIHPTSEGHRVVARLLARRLEP